MRFTLEYPSEIPTAAADFLHPDALSRIAVQAEVHGFDAIALSDHPAPSVKWRNHGGHDTLDPAVALSYFAAVTNTIHLMTHLYVLPFRNPYLAAKALTSLDLVSNGRLIAAVGAGYLRSEFSALGASFDDRAALLDGGLDALVRIWTEPETPCVGDDFAGIGEMWLQRPIQRPHPPIWIGGNSAAARRRVVRHGQGWCPVIAPKSMTSAIRTATIDDAAGFGRAVVQLRDELTTAGRDPDAVDIQVEVPVIDFEDDVAVRRAVEQLAELESLGATWAIVHVDAASVDAATEYLTAFTETVAKSWPERTVVGAS
jgi:probable F420-dependent oxidoreductase